MQSIVYPAVFFGPLFAIALFLYIRRNRNKAFMNLMLYSFIAGMFGALVLLISGMISDRLGITEPRNLKRTLFFSFITVATASELAKFIGFRYFILRKNVEISPSDTIILSTFTGLGFSTVALFFSAVEMHPISRFLPQVLFALSYVPVNLILAVVTGFFVGMARLLKIQIIYSITALFATIFFHGMFIFCMLTRDFKLLSLFAFGASMIVTFLAMKAVYTVPESSE